MEFDATADIIDANAVFDAVAEEFNAAAVLDASTDFDAAADFVAAAVFDAAVAEIVDVSDGDSVVNVFNPNAFLLNSLFLSTISGGRKGNLTKK